MAAEHPRKIRRVLIAEREVDLRNTAPLALRAESAQRLDREGIAHDAVNLAFDGAWHRLGLPELTGGKCVTAYGQTELTRDLQDARERDTIKRCGLRRKPWRKPRR